MTLGELVDLLDEVRRAQDDLSEAERSLIHGGNADTMKRKQERIEAAQSWLFHIREQEIDL